MIKQRRVISIALNVHLPFVREYSASENLSPAGAEGWLFDAISETYLPLLEVLDRLEKDHIPFRLALCFSPVLCQMLSDELLVKKYLDYTARQIQFGGQELERTAGQPEERLAGMYVDRAVERRRAFIERYECDILKAFIRYEREGKIEILGTSATYAFLPFFCRCPEAVQGQMEPAVSFYRHCFRQQPQGFWLPGLGWLPELESCLCSCHYSYTFIEAHGFVFGKPAPARGSFYPVRTPQGLLALSRDYPAAAEFDRLAAGVPRRDNSRDCGYELPPEKLSPVLGPDGARLATGFKYRQVSARGEGAVYDPQAAEAAAEKMAGAFLEPLCARLEEAARYMKETPISVCAWDADRFGRCWYEGPKFLEALFRQGADSPAFAFMTPSEYLADQDLCALERSVPAFSSWGVNGYAGAWLDASSGWIYRHLARAMDRMTEMAERFPAESGLRERALNQAARELLLAQGSDWAEILCQKEGNEYAHSRLEDALRNFTTIYESLGSNYISTEWLTMLEKRHNLFPQINYRVFRRRNK